jgi:hypothetical protein
MGGRLLDFLAQGLAADLPVPADMPARISDGAAAIYYARDTTTLYVFNDATVAWDSILLGGGVSAEAVQDIVGLFIVNGAGIAVNYDDALNQLIVSSSITQYTDEMAADAVGALLAAGADSGVTVTYDDAGNAIAVSVTPIGINALTDVDTLSTPPTNGQTLVWDNAAGLWKPGTITGGGGTPAPTVVASPWGAHRYWRINVTQAKVGGNWIAAGELEFRGEIDGPKLVPTATMSQYNTGQSGQYNDGTVGTTYLSGAALPCWLGVDLGTAKEVKEIVYKSGTVNLDEHGRTFTVQYSDNNTSWTDAWVASNQSTWAANETRVFTDPAVIPPTDTTRVTARYWRLFIATGAIANQLSIATIEFKDAASAIISVGGTPFASSQFDSSYSAANAFDTANTATRWVTPSNLSSGEYIGYDFGGNKAPFSVTITIAVGFVANAPRDIIVQYSNDGINWNRHTEKQMAVWADGVPQTITIPELAL